MSEAQVWEFPSVAQQDTVLDGCAGILADFTRSSSAHGNEVLFRNVILQAVWDAQGRNPGATTPTDRITSYAFLTSEKEPWVTDRETVCVLAACDPDKLRIWSIKTLPTQPEPTPLGEVAITILEEFDDQSKVSKAHLQHTYGFSTADISLAVKALNENGYTVSMPWGQWLNRWDVDAEGQGLLKQQTGAFSENRGKVLECLMASGTPMSVSEVAAATGILPVQARDVLQRLTFKDVLNEQKVERCSLYSLATQPKLLLDATIEEPKRISWKDDPIVQLMRRKRPKLIRLNRGRAKPKPVLLLDSTIEDLDRLDDDDVLAMLLKAGPGSAKEIAEKLPNVSLGWVWLAINRLNKRGKIIGEKRLPRFRLTEKGKAMLEGGTMVEGSKAQTLLHAIAAAGADGVPVPQEQWSVLDELRRRTAVKGHHGTLVERCDEGHDPKTIYWRLAEQVDADTEKPAERAMMAA